MPCHHVRLPDGTAAIVCTGRAPRRRCVGCGRLGADRQCDWKVPARKSGTCDRYVCARCAMQPAPEKDLCPKHAVAWRAWRAEREFATS